jgi:hypothetical protein
LLWPLLILPAFAMFGGACVHTGGGALTIIGLLRAMILVALTFRLRQARLPHSLGREGLLDDWQQAS